MTRARKANERSRARGEPPTFPQGHAPASWGGGGDTDSETRPATSEQQPIVSSLPQRAPPSHPMYPPQPPPPSRGSLVDANAADDDEVLALAAMESDLAAAAGKAVPNRFMVGSWRLHPYAAPQAPGKPSRPVSPPRQQLTGGVPPKSPLTRRVEAQAAARAEAALRTAQLDGELEAGDVDTTTAAAAAAARAAAAAAGRGAGTGAQQQPPPRSASPVDRAMDEALEALGAASFLPAACIDAVVDGIVDGIGSLNGSVKRRATAAVGATAADLRDRYPGVASTTMRAARKGGKGGKGGRGGRGGGGNAATSGIVFGQRRFVEPRGPMGSAVAPGVPASMVASTYPLHQRNGEQMGAAATEHHAQAQAQARGAKSNLLSRLRAPRRHARTPSRERLPGVSGSAPPGAPTEAWFPQPRESSHDGTSFERRGSRIGGSTGVGVSQEVARIPPPASQRGPSPEVLSLGARGGGTPEVQPVGGGVEDPARWADRVQCAYAEDRPSGRQVGRKESFERNRRSGSPTRRLERVLRKEGSSPPKQRAAQSLSYTDPPLLDGTVAFTSAERAPPERSALLHSQVNDLLKSRVDGLYKEVGVLRNASRMTRGAAWGGVI